MERIFYNDACALLGIKIGSLYNAVKRGDLTIAGREGQHKMLSKEQVMLFKGKRISYNLLSQSEKVIWDRCANEIRFIRTPNASIDEEALRRVVAEEVAEETDTIIKRLIDTLEGLRNPKTRAIA